MSEKARLDTNEVNDPQTVETNHRRGKKFRKVLGKIGLDMIPVVFGILIALFINNLRENYQDRKLLKGTLLSLSEEFKKNIEGIQKNLRRQTLLLDTLQYYRKDSTYSIFDLATKAEGIGLAEIYSTNWQISLNNNSLRLLHIRTINLLSKIDFKHRELKDYESIIYPILLGPRIYKRGKEGLDHRKGLEAWLENYIGNQKELLALYEDFEKAIADKR